MVGLHGGGGVGFLMHAEGGRGGGPSATSCYFIHLAQLEILAGKVCRNSELEVSLGWVIALILWFLWNMSC